MSITESFAGDQGQTKRANSPLQATGKWRYSLFCIWDRVVICSRVGTAVSSKWYLGTPPFLFFLGKHRSSRPLGSIPRRRCAQLFSQFTPSFFHFPFIISSEMSSRSLHVPTRSCQFKLHSVATHLAIHLNLQHLSERPGVVQVLMDFEAILTSHRSLRQFGHVLMS